MSEVEDLARLACLDVPDVRLHGVPVLRFEGSERISELCWFELVVVVHDTLQLAELLASLPGAHASLRLRSGEPDGRVFHGDIAAVSTAPKTHLGTVVRMRVESSLCRLKRRITSRVFQQASVQETIERLLQEHEVAGAWRLSRLYPRREQCVQYRESDLAVMQRLLAEEGIFFWLEHGPEETTVVFSDDARFYGAPPFELHMREQASASQLLTGVHNSAFDFSLQQRVVPKSTVSRRYDVERPHLALDAEATGGEHAVMALPLRATNVNDALAQVPVGAVYRHGPSFRPSEGHHEEARILLEQHRRDARLVTGRSDACGLMPGHLVAILDHHVAELDATYVAIEVRHDLDAQRHDLPYQVEFRAVPHEVPYRPQAPEARRIDALELATVVGPEPGSVHTDDLGRIKVRFHWERLVHEEPEGAWVRVAQAWAGAGWGAQFIPRVGTEVVVSFLGGDPDQPVVLGTLYHGGAPHPMAMPDEKHWSGFRSTTLGPRSEGSNELLFSDLPGAEQMVMRAQADFRQHVGSNSAVLVGSDSELRVGGSRAASVSGTDTTAVEGDILVSSRGAYARLVGGDVTTFCEGNLSETVSRGVQRESMDLVETTRYARIVRAGDKLSILVGNTGIEEGAGHYDIATTGSQRRYAGTEATMTAEEAISFVCGESSITLTPKAILLEAPEIRVNGEERTVASGGGAALHLAGGASLGGGEVVIASGSASLVLDADAHLDGGLVKLNCGGAKAGGAAGSEGSEETRTLRMKFANSTGHPYASAAYDLLAAGSRLRGKTTDEGLVEAVVPASAKTVAVTLRPVDSPDEPITWSIDVTPVLPPIDTTAGAKARLQNLVIRSRASTGSRTTSIARR